MEQDKQPQAFKSLSYKRYQHVPLYLEWAPADVFSGPPAAPKPAAPRLRQCPHQLQSLPWESHPCLRPAADATQKVTLPGKATSEALTAGADADASIDSSTIFVKNLSFKTVDAGLTAHFEPALGAARAAGPSR